ncbi:hypothetical protein KSZ_11690 [Dictyobacter formicarum]|uniref:Uncharacterized protein n=2 Tax=Dictyobacter formicarum TaxID=2778368 RepID=A0ABQ3VCN9_9CHLR|nr:hypothetical protein KSZ_11690 [Dictyobacter formicarum]
MGVSHHQDNHKSEGGATFQHQDFHLKLASPLSLEPDGQGGVKGYVYASQWQNPAFSAGEQPG